MLARYSRMHVCLFVCVCVHLFPVARGSKNLARLFALLLLHPGRPRVSSLLHPDRSVVGFQACFYLRCKSAQKDAGTCRACSRAGLAHTLTHLHSPHLHSAYPHTRFAHFRQAVRIVVVVGCSGHLGQSGDERRQGFIFVNHRGLRAVHSRDIQLIDDFPFRNGG